jgi:hypothetical protein
MPRKKKPKPKLSLQVMYVNWDFSGVKPLPDITCPGCGITGDSDLFDCGGAAFGCLWCNACGAHFDHVTEKLVPVVVAGETGVLFR